MIGWFLWIENFIVVLISLVEMLVDVVFCCLDWFFFGEIII